MRTPTVLLHSPLTFLTQVALLVACSLDVAGQTTFRACRVPDVGAIYMIGVLGAPAACLDGTHVEFSWVEGVAAAPGSVTNEILADGAVTSTKILDGAIGSADLGPSVVRAEHIAPGAVGSGALADGSVTQVKLDPGITLGVADGSIATQHLAAGAVTAEKIAPGAVGTAALTASAVTGATIATDAVGLRQLRYATVSATSPPRAPGTFLLQASVQCPAGFGALIGWYSLVDPVTVAAMADAFVYYSLPAQFVGGLGYPDGWTVAYWDPEPAGAEGVRVSAVCVAVE